MLQDIDVAQSTVLTSKPETSLVREVADAVHSCEWVQHYVTLQHDGS